MVVDDSNSMSIHLPIHMGIRLGIDTGMDMVDMVELGMELEA